MTVIGEAFIEILPDTRAFGAPAQRTITKQTEDIAKKASQSFEKNFEIGKVVVDEAGTAAKKASSAFDRGWKLDANGRLRDQFGKFVPAAEQAAARAADAAEAKFAGKNFAQRAIQRTVDAFQEVPRKVEGVWDRLQDRARKRGDDIGDAAGREIAEGIGKGAEKADLGGRFGAIAKKAALAFSVAFAGQQVFSFAGDAINAASDLNETVSKTKVVFGEQGQAVIDFAKTAATNLGLSQRAALEAATQFGTLAKAGGLAGSEASDFSTNLTQLSADLASFSNTTPEEAALALGAALRGEAEPIRRYGVLLDEATLKAAALDAGLIKSTVDQEKVARAQEKVRRAQVTANEALTKFGEGSEQATRASFDLQQAQQGLAELMDGAVPQSLDQATKVQAAYFAIMKQTTDAQGDFARTSDGVANQQRILTAQIEDTKAAIGTALQPAMLGLLRFANEQLIPFFKDFGGKVARVLGPGLEAAAEGIGGFFGGLSGEGITSDGFVGVMELVGVKVRAFVEFLKEQAPKVGRFFADLFDKVGPVVVKIADVLINDVVPAIAEFVSSDLVPFIRDQVIPFIGKIAAVIRDDIIPAITAFVQGPLVDFFRDKVIPAVQAFVDFLVENVPPAIDTISEVVGKIVDFLRPVIEFLVDNVGPVIVDTVKRVGKFFSDFADGISERSERIGKAFHTIVNIVKGVAIAIGIILSPIVIFFRNWGDEIVEIIKVSWEQIQNLIEFAVRIIRDIIDFFLAVFAGDWGAAWDALKDIPAAALEFIVGTVEAIFKTLGQLIQGFLQGALDLFTTIWGKILDVTVGALEDLLGEVIEGIGNIVSEILSIPGKLLGLADDLAGIFLDVGKSIMEGILAGIGAATEFVTDIAKEIVNAIIDFVNDQIVHRFNDLVEFEVSLPFGRKFGIDPPDIPDIPRLAAGGIARSRAGGTLVNVAEAGKDEAIIPLTAGLRRALEALGSGDTAVAGGMAVSIGTIVTSQPERVPAEIVRRYRRAAWLHAPATAATRKTGAMRTKKIVARPA